MTQRMIPRMIKITRAETGNDSESEVNTSWTVQDGVDVTELKVYSSSGEEIEI